jgi:hypothetical protein
MNFHHIVLVRPIWDPHTLPRHRRISTACIRFECVIIANPPLDLTLHACPKTVSFGSPERCSWLALLEGLPDSVRRPSELAAYPFGRLAGGRVRVAHASAILPYLIRPSSWTMRGLWRKRSTCCGTRYSRRTLTSAGSAAKNAASRGHGVGTSPRGIHPGPRNSGGGRGVGGPSHRDALRRTRHREHGYHRAPSGMGQSRQCCNLQAEADERHDVGLYGHLRSPHRGEKLTPGNVNKSGSGGSVALASLTMFSREGFLGERSIPERLRGGSRLRAAGLLQMEAGSRQSGSSAPGATLHIERKRV